ncbi:unnamed protein product [Eruca vesicaria subsp. sativa]|uniref:Pectinesterase inhibitor domain-containing protein n=1 Tax=Eruca vesicaria subsp. sativa TaxID=29727 RepID=A0ABC8IWZ7_ERUVS|nr:unnamed protein product [Eruca vesicaria subsp. sativa]
MFDHTNTKKAHLELEEIANSTTQSINSVAVHGVGDSIISPLLSLTLVTLINSLNIPKTAATPPTTYQNYTTFVKTVCNSTTYPTICYNSLSSYSSTIKADPIKLCTTSLNVNLKYAKYATMVVSNLLKKAKGLHGRDERRYRRAQPIHFRYEESNRWRSLKGEASE